jgi:hypothetical protein
MPLELRQKGSADDWLCAGLCLMRTQTPSAESLERIAPWIVAAQSELGSLPPPGIVADIGRLLTTGAREYAAPPAADLKLRALIRAYEDQLLGRLAADPRLDAASDAIARLPKELQAEAVAVLTAKLLERIRFRSGVSLTAGTARKLSSRSADEVLQTGFARLREPGEVLDTIAAGYDELVKASRHAGQLLTDTEIFTLENLSVLRDLAQRLAIEQMVEAADELTRGLPRRVKKDTRTGRIPTGVEDEDQYPIGGFSSMSTAGSIENLVSSELIYMDDENDSANEGGVDLFTLRYVEGELLYYTRDESVFVRSRRVFTFVLRPDLVKARFKDAGMRWQRLVVVFGMLLCLVRRLSEWLNEEGLLFRIVFLHDASKSNPLGPEKALCELLFREWIEKETAAVVEAASFDAIADEARAQAKTAGVDVVSIGCDPMTMPADPRVRFFGFDVGNAKPRVQFKGAPESDDEPDTAAAWAAATLALAKTLV